MFILYRLIGRLNSAIDWEIDPEIATAIEIASTQTKSAFADSINSTREGGFRLCRHGFHRRVFLCRRGFNRRVYGLRLDRCNPTLDRIIESIAHITHRHLN